MDYAICGMRLLLNEAPMRLLQFSWIILIKKLQLIQKSKKFTVTAIIVGDKIKTKVFSMFYLTAKRKNVKIIHRFLEVGHTQRAGDSTHACIKNHVKHLEAFTQEQWGAMMKDACVESPYDIKHLKQVIIFDYSDLADDFYWRKIQIFKVREICIDPSENTMKIKYDLRKPAQIVDVFKKM